MGTTKNKIKPKTRGSKKTSARVERGSITNDLSSASRLIAETRAHYPALTDAIRGTYYSRFTQAHCDQLGALTKSPNVVSLVRQWLPIISGTLATRPSEIAGYGPYRFAYLLELSADLIQAMRRQSAFEATKNHAVNASQLQRDIALGVRTLLLRKLHTIAGEHAQDASDLNEATGTSSDDTALADSLAALAALANQWLANSEYAQLVSDASLTASDVAHANEAALSLQGTSASRDGSGRRVRQDGPEVNRVEGRVLAELKVAYRVFHDAHETNRLVPVLPLVTGTSQVFTSHKSARATAKPAVTSPTPA